MPTDDRSKPGSKKPEPKVSDLPDRKASSDEEANVKGGSFKRQELDSDQAEPVNG